jgi:hypothetical protein
VHVGVAPLLYLKIVRAQVASDGKVDHKKKLTQKTPDYSKVQPRISTLRKRQIQGAEEPKASNATKELRLPGRKVAQCGSVTKRKLN